jgi:LPXTG-motif cell wall-anchored protein
VTIEESNSAMTWVGFTILCLIALLGLFKDAKRTHLD